MPNAHALDKATHNKESRPSAARLRFRRPAAFGVKERNQQLHQLRLTYVYDHPGSAHTSRGEWRVAFLGSRTGSSAPWDGVVVAAVAQGVDKVALAAVLVCAPHAFFVDSLARDRRANQQTCDSIEEQDLRAESDWASGPPGRRVAAERQRNATQRKAPRRRLELLTASRPRTAAGAGHTENIHTVAGRALWRAAPGWAELESVAPPRSRSRIRLAGFGTESLTDCISCARRSSPPACTPSAQALARRLHSALLQAHARCTSHPQPSVPLSLR